MVTAPSVLLAIARRVGTPVYVYSADRIAARYDAFTAAFGDYPHRVHYALKANSALSVVRLIHARGGGVDANSGGEMEVALRAGCEPGDIVLTGVGKSEDELARAVELGIHAINAESLSEIERIDRLARARGRRAALALRVNPDVAAGSHPHISTGQREHKFGVPLDAAGAICRRAMTLPGVELRGLHVHIGSQLASTAPIASALAPVAELAAELAAEGCPLRHIDVGGGLGIAYDGSDGPDVADYARTVVAAVRPTGLRVIAEPGRWIVGPAGVLVARVVDTKPRTAGGHFVVLDSGMSELLRPALYGAIHRVEPLEPRPRPPALCDIVGPVCETSDVIAAGRRWPLPDVGDAVVIHDAGAYGAVMASNYNRHPLPAEVLVEGDAWRVVRRRQTLDDMLALEH